MGTDMKSLNVFQDADGDYSSKRLVFVGLLGLFVVASIFQLLGFQVAQIVIQNTTDLLKWIGGFVAVERARDFSPFKNSNPPQSPQLNQNSTQIGIEPYE